MYDLVLKEGMWHEIAFSEGKRRRSFLSLIDEIKLLSTEVVTITVPTDNV